MVPKTLTSCYVCLMTMIVLLQAPSMGLFGQVANRLPEYKYSIPGTWFYMLDIRHTSWGFKMRSRAWKPDDLNVDMKGKSVLVAGGNAGIGRSAAETLAGLGATLHLVCRSKDKGEKAVEEIKGVTGSEDIHLHVVDLSSLEQVNAFTKAFAREHDSGVDVLINNAATMQASRSVTSEGHEVALATNLLGFYALTKGLLPALGPCARIVNVVSAGMYTSKFRAKLLLDNDGDYDGATTYSHHHRARVMLTQLWARELAGDRRGIKVNCVHPGWVDTPLLRTAKPMEGFYKMTKKYLRTEQEGADTIVWLAASAAGGETTGKYFMDRKARPTSLPLANTEPAPADYEELKAFCEKYVG